MPYPPPGIIDSIDQIVPAGTFTSPAPGNVSGIITLTVSASDYDQVASVQFQIDGANIGAPDTNAPYSTTYDTRALLNGPHTFQAIVKDRVGNSFTTSVAVTFANAPVVAITAPGNGANVTGLTSFYATVTSYDASVSTQFRVDGANYGAAQPGTGSVGFGSVDTRSWGNGAHTWSVVTTDGHGNSATVSVTVTHVNNPVVALTAPANGATISGTSVVVTQNVTSYDVAATTLTQFKIDGASYLPPQSGVGNVSINLNTQSFLNGSHTITAVTTDAHGNSASSSITVMFANAPVINITSPGNGATVSAGFAFNATITHYDNSCSTVFRIDGNQWGATQSGAGGLGISPDSRSWLNGGHTLQVISTDGHGNTQSASISVTFNNAPTVSITSPSNGATATGSPIQVNASVTSYDATTSTQFNVDGANYGGAQSGSGGKGVSFDSRSWLNGWHTYSVTTTDGHGNSASSSISVYHRNAPVASITTPGNGAYVSGYLNWHANVTMYDSSCTINWYLQGSLWNQSSTPGNGVGYDGLDTHYWPVGNWSLKIIVTDASGNQGSSEVVVYVNNSIPGAQWTYLGNLMSWYGGDDGPGWYSMRDNPASYDQRWNQLCWNSDTWWDQRGQGAGALPPIYAPSNPDPGHYQMRLQFYCGWFETGTDHNHVYGWGWINGIGEVQWADNHGGWGDQAWNINNGDYCYVMRWASDPGWNTDYMQDMRIYWDFVLKSPYNS